MADTLIEPEIEEGPPIIDEGQWCKEDPDDPNISLCGVLLGDCYAPDSEIPKESWCKECLKVAAIRGIII